MERERFITVFSDKRVRYTSRRRCDHVDVNIKKKKTRHNTVSYVYDINKNVH